MSAPGVRLLMAIHCHQPVGNFGFVFEDAFRKSYDPFLATLERHPDIRLSLHYSGSLLDWLTASRPQFLDRVKRLVKQGQVEMLASGYYEPILPMIPEPDRQGQLAQMRQALRRRFGGPITGAWLTERVWEPELPHTLAMAGIRYTMLDVNQFASSRATLPQEFQVQDEQGWDLLGCYQTEYAGDSVVLFPASKRLRYSMPFQEVHRTIEFLKRLVRGSSPVAITFADDGEKFGLWPTTYGWVYEQGWLEQFFQAVEREASWLRTATFSEHLADAGPQGRVYVPCGSYDEMLEWSGGYFRNFFVKYPEANTMHQKMLMVSRRLQEEQKAEGRRQKAGNRRKSSRLLASAQQELYMGQCNCAYWHGVFGGLYLGHLRRAVYEHLLTAERLLDASAPPRPHLEREDLDGDGREELALRSRLLSVTIDPQEDGTVTEVDFYPKAANLTDTLTRRPEPYHEQLKKWAAETGAANPQGRPAASREAVGQAPASIHDALKIKETGLEHALVYDDHRRSNFRDYALAKMPTLQDLIRCTWAEQRLWSSGPWESRIAPRSDRAVSSVTLRREVPGGGELRKTVALWHRHSRVTFGYQVVDANIPVVALEFNLGLLDERWRQAAWQEDLDTCSIQDASLGVAIGMSFDPPATVALFPLETISGSEGGLERTFQGLSCVCLWSTHGLRRWSGTVEWRVGGAA